MATFLSNRDGGKTNEEGHYRFQTKSFTGNVNNGLLVKQNNPLSMSVLVEAGDARIPYQEYGYTWWNDGNLSVSLNTADPSNPRDDVIVAYVDRGVTSSSSVTNNPDIVKIKSVAGSPSASPTPPNNTVIQTSVGAGNPFMILAQVRVGAGVSTVSNGNITDKRTFASPVIADGAVTTDKIADGAVTAGKIDFSTMPKFSVYRTASHGSSNNDTIINFDTTLFDIGSNVSNNRRFTAPVDGYYFFTATAGNSAATDTLMRISLSVNGAMEAIGTQNVPPNAQNLLTVSKLLYLTAGKYVEVYFVGGNGSDMYTGKHQCYFTGFRVG